MKNSGQFQLGALVTEASHPVTARLSAVVQTDISAGLDLLFQADADVVAKFREFAESGRAESIAATILAAIRADGKIFFTGCGSTGRLCILLEAVWRDFWQSQTAASSQPENRTESSPPGGGSDWENRTFSVMAGGDYALIKSVEGFEDLAAFGEKQMADLHVSAKDVVFAITEGGETSFVIDTAWAGVNAGATVYFVYNNPDDVLCEHIQRSREVIQDGRIQKINLTTGPMSITGSTRMQATSIQLCVLLTVMETVVRELVGEGAESPGRPDSVSAGEGRQACTPRREGILAGMSVPLQFLACLETLQANFRSPEVLSALARLVALEESVYRSGHKNNYFAGRFGVDVLTDTTERSPTYCTPPFRKFDDVTAAESWAYLFLPGPDAASAWREILKRPPRCVAWNEAEIRTLVGEANAVRTGAIVRNISLPALMRFRLGRDGLQHRLPARGDLAMAILSQAEVAGFGAADNFFSSQLAVARKAGAQTALICFGDVQSTLLNSQADILSVPVPKGDFLLDGVTRVAVKMVMNALSTCTMVRLGRVLGNYMVWVVPSNLKLIDRATRYITRLTGLDYGSANALLFEVIEYVEPRMQADQAYPPVVALAVARVKNNFTNEQAESFLQAP